MAGQVSGDWVKCPRGELEQLGARLRFHRRCRAALVGLGAAVLVPALVVGAARGWSALTAPEPAGGCSAAAGCAGDPAAPTGRQPVGPKAH
jgi:hypothetical protein